MSEASRGCLEQPQRQEPIDEWGEVVAIHHRRHHRRRVATAATATTAPATAAAAITTIIAITSATDRIAPLPAALLAGLLLVCGLANRVIICCLTNARRGGPRRVKQLVKHTAMARSHERDVSIRPGRSSHHQTMIADLCHELP